MQHEGKGLDVMLFLTFVTGTITGILAMGIITEQVEKNARRQ